MSTLDLLDNGTERYSRRPYRATWLGEIDNSYSDLGATSEGPWEAQSRQPRPDERATQTSVAQAQHSESESVVNHRERLQKAAIAVVDFVLVAFIIAGVCIAAADFGHAWLNVVGFVGGLATTIGAATFAGWMHAKLADVWE